jgi:hypothetical protein
MNRSRNLLILLAILAMLMFALTSLQAQSAATNSTPPISAPSTNAPTRPISDAQFRKLLADLASTNAVVGPTAPIVAKAFGVDHPGETERRDCFQTSDKHYHAISQLDNGNYIFSTSNELISYDYYVDKNLTLISALSVTKQGVTIIPNKDAQADLDAELKTLASIADQL